MCRRKVLRLHLAKGDMGALADRLPGRFAAGQAAADDGDMGGVQPFCPYAFFLTGAFLTAFAAGAAFSGGGMITLR